VTLDDAIKEVARAARTLAPEQGPIARRNARRRVIRALQGARKALDAAFPAPPRRPGKRRTKAEVFEQRFNLMAHEGYVSPSPAEVSACAATGIKIVTFSPRPGVNPYPGDDLMPGWVAQITRPVGKAQWTLAKLKRAKKDIRYRNALIALNALRTSST